MLFSYNSVGYNSRISRRIFHVKILVQVAVSTSSRVFYVKGLVNTTNVTGN